MPPAASPSSSRGNGRLSPSSVSAAPVPSPSLPTAAAAAAAAAVDADNAPSSPIASGQPSPSPPLSARSTSPSSSRSGFLSRLSIPLSLSLPLRSRGRNRNVTDFHVRCDEPYKKYSAGEHVRGAVVVVVVKPLRITHLVVTLHGFVRVLRDPAAVAKVHGTAILPQGGSSSRPQYHGNGSASLFQDEQVLSGEGRLDPGRYEFGFDLVFPDKGLPSSIDFERGTISYMITATLTRPTAIAPTMTCERKVMLAERIDVGLLPPPRPRTIFLEPISKRTKKKKSAMALDKGSAVVPDINDVASEVESLEPSVVAEDPGRDAHLLGQRGALPSDVQSEISGESSRSISTAMSRSELPQLSQAGSAFTSAQQQAVDDKTITATIELLKGGCLPGDTVSVRVTVQHVKQVKSMTGVVVTLFRQGRIDFAPPSTLFRNMMTKEDARRIQKEEIYPKSRTGLGGLSLSSSASASMFRKDLDQTTAPLIIDPDTLRASVTVPVKIPDDSFPTIKGVPGDMISFRYQIEIIVDLGGKLSSQLLGVGAQSSRFGAFGASASEQNVNIFSRGGTNIVDTSQLRREKGVISVSIEPIVGTVDTSGSRKPVRPSPSSRTLEIAPSDDDEGFFPTPSRYEEPRHSSPHPNEPPPPPPPQSYFPPQANNQHYYTSPPPHSHSHPHPHPHPHPHRPEPSRHNYSQPNDDYPHGPSSQGSVPLYLPPPQVPDQNTLSEKDRIRQAETRLLPSQPPGATSPAGPSCPDDDDIYDAQATPRPGYSGAGQAADEDDASPSAPTEEELTAAITAAANHPAEDKQELERRRLMQEASAPPEFPEDMDGRNEGGRAPGVDELVSDAEPVVPVLDEDDDDYPGYGTGVGPSGGSGGGEQLPAYRR